MIVRLVRYVSPSCPLIPTGKWQSGVQHFPSEWTSNQAVTFGWWTNPWHHVGRFLNLTVFFCSSQMSTEIRDYCRTFLCCWRCWRGGRKSGFCTFLLVEEKNKSRYIAPFFLWLFFPRYMWLLVRVRCSRMGGAWVWHLCEALSIMQRCSAKYFILWRVVKEPTQAVHFIIYTKVKQGCVAMKSFVCFYWSDKSCPHEEQISQRRHFFSSVKHRQDQDFC